MHTSLPWVDMIRSANGVRAEIGDALRGFFPDGRAAGRAHGAAS
jgi:hypothetical protein